MKSSTLISSFLISYISKNSNKFEILWFSQWKEFFELSSNVSVIYMNVLNVENYSDAIMVEKVSVSATYAECV